MEESDHGPEPPEGGWLPLDFPERFVLEVLSRGEWLEWGVYLRESVFDLPDGSYVAASDGMPIYLRCIDKRDNVLEVIADTGEHITYRIRELSREEPAHD